MTELRTDRLVLRRARPEDLDSIHAVLSDARSMLYWSNPPHSDIEQSRQWLDSMVHAPPEASDDFVIVHAGEVIGKMGAWRLPEFGFILRSDMWGRGFASEAIRAFLDHAFRRPGLDALVADVDPRNTASLRLLHAHGFTETGRAANTWTTHLGSCDSVYLRLDRAGWLNRAG